MDTLNRKFTEEEKKSVLYVRFNAIKLLQNKMWNCCHQQIRPYPLKRYVHIDVYSTSIIFLSFSECGSDFNHSSVQHEWHSKSMATSEYMLCTISHMFMLHHHDRYHHHHQWFSQLMQTTLHKPINHWSHAFCFSFMSIWWILIIKCECESGELLELSVRYQYTLI